MGWIWICCGYSIEGAGVSILGWDTSAGGFRRRRLTPNDDILQVGTVEVNRREF